MLEVRAAPGGGLLELLLGVPLLGSLLKHERDDGTVDPHGFPSVRARPPEYVSALAQWGADFQSLEELLRELRAGLAAKAVKKEMADRYVDVARQRIEKVTDALARPETADLFSHDFLKALWWVDELAASLAQARVGGGGVTPMDSGGGNTPPVAEDDCGQFGAMHDTTLQQPAPGVKWNDWDAETPVEYLTVSLISGPAHAAYFELQPDGSFTYVPEPLWAGADEFTYQLSDGEYTDEALAEVYVYNYPPDAGDDSGWELGYSTDAVTKLVVDAEYGLFQNDWDPEGDEFWISQHTDPAHGTLTLLDVYTGAFEYMPDGTFVGEDTFTYRLTDGALDHSTGQTTISNTATVSIVVVPHIDLDAKTIEHNVPTGDLADDLEDSPGAFLPVNNDDDDYDAWNSPDYLQSGAIAGESDLLPIVLRRIQPSTVGGWYQLHIPANVRVWRNPDRTDLVEELTTFPAAAEDETLYVEGCQAGSSVLSLDWWNESQRIDGADAVAVTVFSWGGPLNVPDYSKHWYTASWATAGPPDSRWIDAHGGTLVDPYDGQNIDYTDILWSAGPAVGKAVYQAHPNYIWDLEVNVVEVIIEPPDVGNAFNGGTVVDNGTILDGGTLWKHVTLVPGTDWAAKVSLNGPLDDRGVKFMRVGFVQDAHVGAYHANYDTESLSLTSSIESQAFLDCDQGATPPYYSTVPEAVFFDPDPAPPPPQQPRKTKTISESDAPSAGPPLTFDQGATVEIADDVVDSMNLAFLFQVYVTARTIDGRNGASDIYTVRARGDWSLNGSGTIQPTEAYEWTGGGAGVTVPAGWTAVTDGSEPLRKAGPLFADALNSDTWT